MKLHRDDLIELDVYGNESRIKEPVVLSWSGNCGVPMDESVATQTFNIMAIEEVFELKNFTGRPVKMGFLMKGWVPCGMWIFRPLSERSFPFAMRARDG